MSEASCTPLSAAQRAALADPRPRLLVSAAAGSGKTRLLVARLVQALLEQEVAPERIVAVTFTRAAAAELAERVRQELLLRGRPDLARLLDAATIGTIHSLCRRLLKDHAVEAQVDPSCAVLAEEEARMLKEEALKAAWEQVLTQADEAELMALAHNGRGLPEQAIAWYDRLRSLGQERPEISVLPGPGVGHCQAELLTLVSEALAGAEALKPWGSTLERDLEALRNCLAWLEAPLSTQERAAQLEVTLRFFPSARSSRARSLFAPVRQALTRYRCALAEERLRPLVGMVNRLLFAFHEEYQALKRERGVLDFADLELKARDLVLRGDVFGSRGGEQTRAWLSLAEAVVLVDEFQDTNELQCSILEGLGAARLLMVGDERQSIYRFRGADVTVFRKREQELETGGGDGSGGVRRLDVNHRSSREVLSFINYLFAQEGFFGPDFVRLIHPEESEDSLSSDRSPVPFSDRRDPLVEVLVAERQAESDKEGEPVTQTIQEAEARVVADRVRRLLDEEKRKESDVAVLLPAYTYVDVYQRALRERGIEVYLTRGRQFFSREEVRDLIAFLRVLVNPLDDLALVTVLRSPLVGLSDDGLYLVSRTTPNTVGQKGTLWERIRGAERTALSSADLACLERFLTGFARLRPRVGRPGLGRLIDEIMSTFDYDFRLLRLPDGKRRLANVRKLMRMANEYEGLSGPDLAGLVEVLRSRGDADDREGEAPILGEADNVVQLSTIHQAKGLEFPVVILAGLGSDVSHGGGGPKSTVVIGDDGRVGVFLRGSRHHNYEESDLCWGPGADIEEEIRAKEEAEDVRLLYVAMTRAKEHLVLVGAEPRDTGGPSRMKRILRGLGIDGELPQEETLVERGETRFLVRLVGQAEGEKGRRERQRTEENLGSAEPPASTILPALLPEVSHVMRPRQVSFSSISLYQLCPRRFFFERVLGLGEEAGFARGDEGPGLSAPWETTLPDEGERRAGLEVGLLVHALLERLESRELPPAAEKLRQLAEDWLLETGLGLEEPELDRALQLTLAFWDSPLLSVWASPRAIKEAPFLFEQAGVAVSGVMDVFCPENDLARIVDYKTNRLGGRSPVELAQAYTLQAAVYSLAALRGGASAVQMDFVFLEQARDPVSFVYSSAQEADLEAVVERALAGLLEGDYRPRQGEDCRLCPVGELCDGLTATEHPVADWRVAVG